MAAVAVPVSCADGWWVPADIAALTPPRSRPPAPCRHPDGCTKQGRHGYCDQHLCHLAVTGSFDLPRPNPRDPAHRRCHHPDGCDRAHKVHGLCGRHYQRLVGTGLLGGLDDLHVDNSGPCRHPDGCDRTASVRGWCKMHYDRVLRNGDAGKAGLRRRYRHASPTCAHPDGCTKPTEGHGLCGMHHARLRRGRPLGPGHAYFGRKDRHRPCARPGCPNPINSTGWCPIHDPTPDPPGPRAPGVHGYVYRSTLSGPRFEHRLLMAALLERPLTSADIVHHRNGRRADNRIENLEHWVAAHPSGQRVSDLIDFVLTHHREQVETRIGQMQEKTINTRAPDPSPPTTTAANEMGVGEGLFLITARTIRATGYVDARVTTTDGTRWRPEHRAVMEHHLGRALRRGESVHHRNGNRADNHPDNLELWTTAQPPGQRIGDVIDWLVRDHDADLVAARVGRPGTVGAVRHHAGCGPLPERADTDVVTESRP